MPAPLVDPLRPVESGADKPAPTELARSVLRTLLNMLLPDSVAFDAFLTDEFGELKKKNAAVGMDRQALTSILLVHESNEDVLVKLARRCTTAALNQACDEIARSGNEQALMVKEHIRSLIDKRVLRIPTARTGPVSGEPVRPLSDVLVKQQQQLITRYSSAARMPALWLVLLTVLPPLLFWQSEALGLSFAAISGFYLLYHVSGLYLWWQTRHLDSKLARLDGPQQASLLSRMRRWSRGEAIATKVVLFLLALTVAARLRVEVGSSSTAPDFPLAMYKLLGVQPFHLLPDEINAWLGKVCDADSAPGAEHAPPPSVYSLSVRITKNVAAQLTLCNPSLAYTLIDGAQKRAPRDGNLLIIKAKIELALKEYDAALKTLDSVAAQLGPSNELYKIRARCFVKIGDSAKAQAAYQVSCQKYNDQSACQLLSGDGK